MCIRDRRELKSLLLALPKDTPAQHGLSRQLDQALKNGNWDDYRKPLVDFIKEHSAESSLAWGELITELLRQWEAKQSGLTPARKRESLDRVLSAGAKNSELLFNRLQSLTKSWSLNQAEPENVELAEIAAEAPTETVSYTHLNKSPSTRTGLIALVPDDRIELPIDDYKSTVIPFN